MREGISPQIIIRNTANGPCPFSCNSSDFSPPSPPENMEALEALQATRITDTLLMICCSLCLYSLWGFQLPPPPPKSQLSAHFAACKAQPWTLLPFQKILALACSPLPAFSSCLEQHRPLGPAVFSLQREEGGRTIPSVSAIPNVLCYILLCSAAQEERRM